MDENRKGRFLVAGSLLTDPSLEAIMRRCIITRAEHLWHQPAFDYFAISDDFEPLDEGEIIPEYTWQFTKVGIGTPYEGVSIKAVRC